MISYHEVQSRLVLHEGMLLKPYICPAGYLTIGVGRNLITNPLSCKELEVVGKNYKDGISESAAFFLLKNDINRCERELAQNISWFNQLDDERQYALLDMCFNLGIKRLLGFKKMLGAIFIGDYRGAAKECLNSKYAKDVGKRAQRIAKLIERGVWMK